MFLIYQKGYHKPRTTGAVYQIHLTIIIKHILLEEISFFSKQWNNMNVRINESTFDIKSSREGGGGGGEQMVE